MRNLSFYVEYRHSAIKVQRQQSDGSGGKSSNPHTNLTKHHTCRANFLLARHNTQPLDALKSKCRKNSICSWLFDIFNDDLINFPNFFNFENAVFSITKWVQQSNFIEKFIFKALQLIIYHSNLNVKTASLKLTSHFFQLLIRKLLFVNINYQIKVFLSVKLK